MPRFTRAQLARAAISLAESGGLGAVSMRSVAEELDTAAGSLYRYVASRGQLIDLMIDTAVADLDVSTPSTPDAVADLLHVARGQLRLYRLHPWLIEALPAMTTAGPHVLDVFDHCLRLLSTTPVDSVVKMEAIAVMTGVVSLFARPSSPVSFEALDPVRHAFLAAAVSAPGAGRHSSASTDELFDRTIRAVLTSTLGLPHR